jgi:hypothetical protein
MFQDRRETTADQLKETGTVQEETQLLQSLDRCIEYQDDQQIMKEKLKLSAEEQEADKRMCIENRDNLLMRTKQKRTAMGLYDPSDDSSQKQSDTEDDENDDGPLLNPSMDDLSSADAPLPPTSRKRPQKKEKRREIL